MSFHLLTSPFGSHLLFQVCFFLHRSNTFAKFINKICLSTTASAYMRRLGILLFFFIRHLIKIFVFHNEFSRTLLFNDIIYKYWKKISIPFLFILLFWICSEYTFKMLSDGKNIKQHYWAPNSKRNTFVWFSIKHEAVDLRYIKFYLAEEVCLYKIFLRVSQERILNFICSLFSIYENYPFIS